MASTRTRRPEPCAYENCGSRRFHVDDDGYTYCDRGHQQSERGTVIAEDTGELIIHGTKSRKKDSDAESTTSRGSGFSGTRAFEHYLLCIQLVLRKQLRWLIDIQKLPEELEKLVRDLWALRLQSLRARVSYDSETETEAQSSQVFSLQSESETASGSQSSRRSRRKDKVLLEETPTLLDSITLCYTGILLIRIPVTVTDIHRWINNGELLYYRASRELPIGMKSRLPSRYQELLDAQDLLQPQWLHQNVFDVLTKLEAEFGMAAPPINTSLTLFRWIRELALPLEVFVATQRLGRILKIDGLFSSGDTNIVLRYPEVRLMALAIITTKLLLPFDDVKRHSDRLIELSSLSMDWDRWTKIQQSGNNDNAQRSRLSFEKAFTFTESDAIDAADDVLDSYLDWYQENVATDEIRERGRAGREADFRKALFEMFPAKSEVRRRKPRPSARDAEEIEERIRCVQSTLTLRQPPEENEEEDTPRPGSFYRRFRNVEELSRTVKVFYEKASALAGMPLDGMVQAVFLLERRLQKFEEGLRKAAKGR